MDFFDHQDRARRKSGILVLYFLAAVALIVAAVYFAFYFSFVWLQDPSSLTEESLDRLGMRRLWNPRLFAAVAGGTVFVVFCGSLYKIHSLSGGGATVAEMLGGIPISPSTADPDQRKILNVVEEMAIASGTPVPPVYLLDKDKGINAFAAGFSTGDAVIGVTQGCIKLLSRDELQGVMAHEFSHILNGDMRTDIRLIGLLHGILLIGIAGKILLRAFLHSGSTATRRRSRSDKEGGGHIGLILFALALFVVGYIGVFFGRLIKSALSRQREYLADASAVQFTRNPDGIAGALKKIGGWSPGSELRSARAEEAGHIFFGNGLPASFVRVLSTHPPLEDRIRRIDPSFEGKFEEVLPGEAFPDHGKLHPEVARLYAGKGKTPESETPGAGMAASAAALIGMVGAPRPEHVAYAERVKEEIPETLRTAARDAFGARAVVYGLLLDPRKEVRDRQLAALETGADPPVYRTLLGLLPEFERLEPEHRLPLLDISIPGLQNLSPNQFVAFRENIGRLIAADERVDLFEFTLQRVLIRHLEARFKAPKKGTAVYYSLKKLRDECALLLSIVAHAGHGEADEATAAFQGGAEILREQVGGGLPLKARRDCGFEKLRDALDRLATVAPKLKRPLLQACATCAMTDRTITVREGELLRLVADTLDCPMPPLLPGFTA